MISFPTWRCRKIATVHANPLHFQQVAPYVESRHGDSMLPAIDADTLAPVIFRRCYLPCMCGCILRWSPYTLEKQGSTPGRQRCLDDPGTRPLKCRAKVVVIYPAYSSPQSRQRTQALTPLGA